MRFVRFVLKMFLSLVIIVVVALGAAFLFGPRTPVDTTIRFDAASIGPDVDAYLAAEEGKIADIRPGLQKQVIWAYPGSKAKTPLAIVYVHGFSASLGEARPYPDLVAKELGANLFYTRLDGHGRAFDAMGSITINNWVNDMAEALAVGHAIGEKVVVISTSTGGSLVSWALGQPQLAGQIDAAVFISPNYGVKAGGAFLLTMPFAKDLAHMIVGPRRSFVPENERHKEFWTYDYPTDALLPMAESVKLAVNQPFESFKAPALFFISQSDQVVQPELTRAIVKRWGAPAKLVEVDKVDDPYGHVLTGDALSPSTTADFVAQTVAWIKATLPGA